MNRKQTHGIMSLTVWLLLVTPAVESAEIPKTQAQLPVIDVHAHANMSEDLFKGTYAEFRKHNVVKAIVSSNVESVGYWKSMDVDNRIIPGLLTWDPNVVSPGEFENLLKSGRIKVFGELIPIYSGLKLSDPVWYPYLQLCTQYDIPVFAHTGQPEIDDRPFTHSGVLSVGDPYLIQDVLVRYPKLRVCLCHSGIEWHEHALTMMTCYKKLYSDLAGVLWRDNQKRHGRDFLFKAKEAGCLDRVMFGTDAGNWDQPVIRMSIDYLNSLDFLTEKDKRDILYNNAVRFLRLKE